MTIYPGVSAMISAGSPGGTPGSTGFVSPGTAANNASAGTTAWSTPGNILVSDNVRAFANRSSPGTTQLLYASGFDFSSVPDTSTITGVRVLIERGYSSTGTSSVRDNTLRLTKDGSALVGDNKADTATDWPKGDDVQSGTYGATDNLWGTTLTPAEVKASTFGVMLMAEFVAATVSTNARVDHVQMAIDWVD